MQDYSEFIAEAKNAPANEAVARRALACMDLTSLGDDDDDETILTLYGNAVTPMGQVAAVCIWDRFIPTAKMCLEGTGVRIATVCNFPHGGDEMALVTEEARKQVVAGAHEIDLVLPWRAWLAGDTDRAKDVIRGVRLECGTAAKIKVILETGELKDPQIIQDAAEAAIWSGADFIKTSTGKVAVGATLEAAAVMLGVIKEMQPGADRPLGFKPAGGISTVQDAASYLHLADAIMGPDWATPETFRIGASSLLGDIRKVLGAE